MQVLQLVSDLSEVQGNGPLDGVVEIQDGVGTDLLRLESRQGDQAVRDQIGGKSEGRSGPVNPDH